ncbi:MAG: hypothetical protein K2L48_04430 [Mycoplasmoidaceae bacterium]|nr:hypothetical protein [Mycoplasmoidaceae bacterium]
MLTNKIDIYIRQTANIDASITYKKNFKEIKNKNIANITKYFPYSITNLSNLFFITPYNIPIEKHWADLIYTQ